MSPADVRPVGDRGTLIQLPSNAAVHVAASLARERYGDELEEVIPGHDTLLLVWRDGGVELSHADLTELTAGDFSSAARGRLVTIPVAYDGPDLERVASKLGVSGEAVAELHAEVEFTVAFMGFMPGFPYLIADREVVRASPLLELPRLDTPRTQVPAGSVAVAAGYCGIYPRSSPGGWNLLGRTDVVLFDARRDPPALLEPGMRVRFQGQ